MKKKRNTKSKDRITFLITFLFLLFCLFGAAYCIKKFYDSMNTSLRKMNERPIATIQFKRKTAQRKFEERMVWDRLKQNSPVYNGDTIRTAPESEATIYFRDGNVMELGENTMAQIFFYDGMAQTNIEEGEVVVNSTGSGNGAIVSFGDSRVEMQAGTSLVGTTLFEEGNAKIDVMGGQAIFTGADGVERTLQEGTSLALDESGKERTVPLITVVSPKPNEKVLNFEGGANTVNFKWFTKNLQSDDYLVLEISNDKKFKKVVQKKELKDLNEFQISLENGIYHWRVFPIKSGMEYSAQSKLSVLDMPRPGLIIPENETEFSYKSRKPDVRFAWTQNDWVADFEFEIADNPQLSAPVIKQRISTPSSIVSTLGEGVWYWRVTPYYTINSVGFTTPSDVHSFKIEKKGALETVELIIPAANDMVNTSQSDSISFSWKNNFEAGEYEIFVAADSDFTQEKIHQKQKTNFLNVKADELDMQVGTWYWYVNQYDADGEFANKSEVRKFSTDKVQFEQKMIYPPHNYTTSDLNAADLRFSWKSTVPGDTVFQIARDSNFNDCVVNETNNEQHHQGTGLAGGTYYWRVASKDAPEKYATAPRTLNIISPLETPVLVSPTSGSSLDVGQNSNNSFTWKTVAGADYYLFNFYKASNMESAIRSERVNGTTYSFDLKNYDDGEYAWTVQAGTEEKTYAAPRFSGIGKNVFAIRQKEEKTLASSKLLGEASNNAVFNAERIRQSRKIDFEWTAVPDATDYAFTIRNERGAVLINRNVKDTKFQLLDMAELGNGRYTWSVQALQRDKDGKISNNGEISTSTFVIDLPEVKEIIINNTGVLYGI